MKTNQHISKYAVCPYYHKQDDHRIYCEGTDPKNTISIVFGEKYEQKKYENTYCNSIQGCRKCMIHKALDTKYQ